MIKGLLGILLSMLGTVLFAAVFIFIFANSTEMACQRQPDQTYKCAIQKRLFGKLTTSSQVVSGVVSAKTEESCDNDGCAYRTELLSSDGNSTPFNDVYTDHAPVAAMTDQINADIGQNSGAAFSVEDPTPLWVIFLIGGMAIVALAVEGGLVVARLFQALSGRR